MSAPVERACNYEGCEFVVPDNTKHAVNSMNSHRRSAHGGWSEVKRVKPQFLALYEATGSFDLACYFADQVIDWNRPQDEQLRAWIMEHDQREEQGQPIVNQRQIDRMERKVRKAQEWESRKALDVNRKASMIIAQQVIDKGTTEKPQLLQYLGMNNAYQMKELAVAYPMQVTKRRRTGSAGGAKIIGVKPQKALPAPDNSVPGVFRVIEGADANRDG